MNRRPSVLVVASSGPARAHSGRWLEKAGYDVLFCPGPRAPEYECIGGRTGSCPLAESADVIVLDEELGGDLALRGTSSDDLAQIYRGLGKPLVTLAPWETEVRPAGTRTLRIPWPPRRRHLLAAVERLTGRPGRGS